MKKKYFSHILVYPSSALLWLMNNVPFSCIRSTNLVEKGQHGHIRMRDINYYYYYFFFFHNSNSGFKLQLLTLISELKLTRKKSEVWDLGQNALILFHIFTSRLHAALKSHSCKDIHDYPKQLPKQIPTTSLWSVMKSRIVQSLVQIQNPVDIQVNRQPLAGRPKRQEACPKNDPKTWIILTYLTCCIQNQAWIKISDWNMTCIKFVGCYVRNNLTPTSVQDKKKSNPHRLWGSNSEQ